MSTIDLESLLAEVTGDEPCGPNLEYDAGFVELERASAGKPEQQIGDTVVAAEPPDWREVRKLATDLASKTRDLRVAVHLARALARTAGMPGLADGLELVHGLIERHWDGVHPQLDPDDDNDPTMRVNTLLGLCDPDTMLPAVREAVLVESRALGRFSYRDMQIAAGDAPAPEGHAAPDPAAIEGAFMDCDVEALAATAAAVESSEARIRQIETVLTERVGTGSAADLSALPTLLKEIRVALAERLARRGIGEGAATEAGGAAGPAGAVQAITGEITSREDVVRVLDKACAYFNRHEPSSPVPLLLQRAKRLVVAKDFMEIIRDVAPDGLSQVENLRGVRNDE